MFTPIPVVISCPFEQLQQGIQTHNFLIWNYGVGRKGTRESKHARYRSKTGARFRWATLEQVAKKDLFCPLLNCSQFRTGPANVLYQSEATVPGTIQRYLSMLPDETVPISPTLEIWTCFLWAHVKKSWLNSMHDANPRSSEMSEHLHPGTNSRQPSPQKMHSLSQELLNTISNELQNSLCSITGSWAWLHWSIVLSVPIDWPREWTKQHCRQCSQWSQTGLGLTRVQHLRELSGFSEWQIPYLW